MSNSLFAGSLGGTTLGGLSSLGDIDWSWLTGDGGSTNTPSASSGSSAAQQQSSSSSWSNWFGGGDDPDLNPGGTGGEKHSAGAWPRESPTAPCPAGMGPDPLNPSYFCIWTSSNPSCGPGQYLNPATRKCEANPELGPGGVSPWVNPCPSGQTTYNGKCVPYKSCPDGQTFNLATQKCEASYTHQPGGGGGKLPVKTPPVTELPPEHKAGFGLWGLALLAAAGGGGYLLWKRRQRRLGLAPKSAGRSPGRGLALAA